MGNVARRLASLGGPLLVAAVLCGLLAMHGLQPSPDPAPIPSVLSLRIDHAHDAGMPMSSDDRPHDGKGSSHDGHGGGQVCLAFLLAGAVLMLFAVTTVLSRHEPLSLRSVRRRFPRGPTARPRGPTLAQLCVIRV